MVEGKGPDEARALAAGSRAKRWARADQTARSTLAGSNTSTRQLDSKECSSKPAQLIAEGVRAFLQRPPRSPGRS
jgi:hypothetical protein